MSTRQSLPNSNVLSALAEAPIRFMDGAAMDYFLIEMVNTLRASSAVATARAKKLEQEMVDAGLIPPPPAVPPSLPLRGNPQQNSARKVSKEVDEDAVRARLEAIGMHVGANFTERSCLCPYRLHSMVDDLVLLTCRLSRDKVLFSDTLEAIKFVCKDVWTAFWDKQVDNLRTNHRVSLTFTLRRSAVLDLFPGRLRASR